MFARTARGEMVEDWVRALTGGMSLSKASEIIREKRTPKKLTLKGAEGRELIRQRCIFVRSMEYLKQFQKQEVAVSIWEVLRKVGARKPWERSGDMDIVFEAAKKIGMGVVERENTIVFK